MQNKSRISFGPGAASIILILVILSMSILAILSLISAKGEIRLAERSSEVIKAVCALNTKAEEMAAEIDRVVAAVRESGQTGNSFLRACSCRKTPFPGRRRTGRDSCHAHWK